MHNGLSERRGDVDSGEESLEGTSQAETDQMLEERFADEGMAAAGDTGPGNASSRPSASEADLLADARRESTDRTTRRSRRGEFIDTAASDPNSGTAHSDEALFARYQSGDEAAFLVIYERYKSSIFAYCAQVLLSAGLSRDLVEDTFQDVFLRLTQYRHTFTGGEFKAWIFTVTRHSCLSAKKLAFRDRASTEFAGNLEGGENDASPEVRRAFSHTDDPLDRMTKAEQADLLTKAIARLPEEFREALMMSEFEGLTYDEIGRITGTSLSTIRIRIYRAKSRLRKMLLPIIGDDVDNVSLTSEPQS